ncbi:DUF2844 domain-containing protein [Paraburkholderia sp. FT54]|uniref:DUF2844 domain-containing protein n=1 Tax=Paraburkholderia sp. FT54 TaxID=3074437 RepID=UPI0028773D62|nr:DUF2844 domain-containing protein [Paraburkholderia sp. FT54]WNC89031.1 DUF2844 domain-containing protein [Paraburkholderia sp. FT54]
MRLSKIAMLAATLLPLSSHATLGGAPSTSASSPALLRATPQSAVATPAAQPANAVPYSMRQSIDANAVTIREYVLPENIVFAVKWSGPIRPDMTALLGSYFPNFVSAGQSHASGTGPLIDGNDDFRIESAGRLGRFSGMAWLPRLMPAGVRPGDLK